MEAFLPPLVEPLFSDGITYEIQNLRGKERLLKSLPSRLRGYQSWGMDDLRIVVLVDRDRDDCRVLKGQLESIAKTAGLRTKSEDSANFQVVNRIVIEELEAWLLGDPDALRAAYPRLPSTFENRTEYRDPDAILGGTAESLLRLLQSASYYSTGLPKQTVALEVARHMVPVRNRSKSFHVFWNAMEMIVKRSP